ncbi:MAG: hypothetical protein F6K26_17995 [Moorea sp. SIO2I5]|nr:hypothetical protein [Moorena sp. SIO2I5]
MQRCSLLPKNPERKYLTAIANRCKFRDTGFFITISYTEFLPIPCSLFPIPYSLFPIPCSLCYI